MDDGHFEPEMALDRSFISKELHLHNMIIYMETLVFYRNTECSFTLLCLQNLVLTLK